MNIDGIGIYCYENLVNGKKYVGQSKMLKIRIRDHERHFKESTFSFSGENKSLWRAVRKYGRENFRLSILQYCDEADLDTLEKMYINTLGSHKSVHGYNFSWGGDSTILGMTLSKKTRRKMSESRKGNKNPFFGRKHSDSTKKKISEWRMLHPEHNSEKGEHHHSFGRKHSDQIKSKMSRDRMGVRNVRFGKKLSRSSSKYFGVCRDLKCKNIWVSQITYQKKRVCIGRFNSEEGAAIAYNKYVLENNYPHPLNVIGDVHE